MKADSLDEQELFSEVNAFEFLNIVPLLEYLTFVTAQFRPKISVCFLRNFPVVVSKANIFLQSEKK